MVYLSKACRGRLRHIAPYVSLIRNVVGQCGHWPLRKEWHGVPFNRGCTGVRDCHTRKADWFAMTREGSVRTEKAMTRSAQRLAFPSREGGTAKPKNPRRCVPAGKRREPYSKEMWFLSRALRMAMPRTGAKITATAALKMVAGSLATTLSIAASAVRPPRNRPL